MTESPKQPPGGRRPPRITLQVAATLCVKLSVIFVLWYCFFGPEKRVEQVPENIAAHLLDTAPAPQEEPNRSNP